MNRSRSSHLLLLGCASLLLGACVQSGSGGGSTLNLEQQVQQHDMQLRQLQPAQADAWNQLQAMRQELNTLKGQTICRMRAARAPWWSASIAMMRPCARWRAAWP